MHGITLAKAQRHGVATAEDLRQITDEKVAEIYQQDYFRFYEGLDDSRVATKIFDLAVNMQDVGSHGPAIRIVQEALNALGAGLDVDGCWGPQTEASVNAANPVQLLAQLCQEAADHYRAIVAAHPERGKFLHGWLNRAAEVPA
jgi:lysozyme family protein